MKDSIEISIIIVNYNTTDHLRKCLNSIETNLNSNGIEIIVVDNNSSDRSIEKIKDEYPEIKLFLQALLLEPVFPDPRQFCLYHTRRLFFSSHSPSVLKGRIS